MTTQGLGLDASLYSAKIDEDDFVTLIYDNTECSAYDLIDETYVIPDSALVSRHDESGKTTVEQA